MSEIKGWDPGSWDEVSQKIGHQVKAWGQSDEIEKKPFITISREFGAEGWILAQKVEEALNKEGKYNPAWVSYNKGILEKVEEDQNLSKELVESLDQPAKGAIEDFFNSYFADKPPRIAIFKKTARTIKTLASHGHVIIVGRGGCFITQGMAKGFHIRTVAPLEWRVETVRKQQNISKQESEKLVKSMENERDAFIKDYFFTDVSDPHYYDLVINSGKFNLDNAADLVLYELKKRKLI